MGWWGRLRFRVLFFSIFLWCLAQVTTATPSPAGEAAYPRLANYYLHGHVDYSRLVELARWDVVILNTVWTEPELAALRSINPDIKIYLYVCAYCVESPANQNDPWSVQLHRYAEDHQLWWYNADGDIASDWPGVKMINVVSPAARGPIGDWLSFLELMIRQLVQQRPSVDGVFFDNFWRQISWNQDNLRLDSDCHPLYNPDACNGIADSPASLDYEWNKAMRTFARRMRTSFDLLQTNRARPLSILSNSSSDYFESLNGTLYEFFPSGPQPDYGNPHGYAWRENMFQWPGGYTVAPFRTNPYRVSVINASWHGSTLEPWRTEGFERHKRFTLGSTLLGDGYFSFDTGPQGHGNLWWEPEYDNGGSGKGYLGQPAGKARSIAPRGVNNLVSNGDFSAGLETWNARFTNAEGDAFVTAGSAGRHLLQLAMPRLTHPGGHARLSHPDVRITRNKAHTLRFTGQAITPTEIEVQLNASECPNSNCIRTWRFGLGSVPEEFAISFVAPASSDATLSFLLRAPGLVRLQNVSLLNGSQDIYRRDFEKGVVLVNYTTEPQLIDLGAPLTRLSLPGSAVHDGRQVALDIIPSGDAIIYLKVSEASKQQQPGTTQASSPTSDPQVPRVTLQSHRNETSIRYELQQATHVSVRVFDVRGRLVRTLQTSHLAAAGTHQLLWHGEDDAARPAAQGVYFIQLQTPVSSTHRKLVLIR